MDAKDLRTDTTIGERVNDGSSKFAQSGAAPPCSTGKTYENISSNPLAKLEAPTSRPCAVIGPDRIVPPSNGDAYSKKSHFEPWPHVDNSYRQPPEYPHKLGNYQSPIRNISPRQTFQENMQRIMVQPTYNSVKLNEDPNYTLDRSATKNNKITGPHEVKYCEVPYSVNPLGSDQKPAEMCVTNMNSSRNYPQMWHPGGVGIRPTRPYGAPDLYQFPEYTNCAAPRPMPMARVHRTINEDPSHAYSETYYHEGNIRFKPYPTVKERYPQARYEYVSSYANPFHPPPPFPSHKYDMQKPLPPHLSYPQVPIKYVENRITDSGMEGYRPQQVNYNVPYRNQIVHPQYGPMIGSNLQNKVYPYPPDGHVKSLAPNKLPYDSKLYAEYDNTRNKVYPMSDNMYLPHMKNQPMPPNYPPANMQPIHGLPCYRKENIAAKNYEYMSHLRHIDPSMNPNVMTRLSNQFSPNSIAISPSDSNTSNETSHTHNGSLEDCGYVSQSSTTSMRSYDSGAGRIMPNDFHRRFNYPYQSMVRMSPSSSKPEGIRTTNSPKDKKGIDVRQFLQMWNEGEEESGGKEKEVVNQSDFNSNKLANQHEAMKTHDQLYVLGLVNVPSEELGKYEHIQKISKLPDNIKGYNNIELLKHFEEAIESSNISNSNLKPTQRSYHAPIKSNLAQGLLPPRPISPLDVEAKISQSVIHKEVGCNFEIKPCSPEMLNAEIATPAQSIIGEERVIEKVTNPMIIKSPLLSNNGDSEKVCDGINKKEHQIMMNESPNTPSCNMIHNQCSSNEVANVKTNYSLQDLESNAGVCLASLPRLDNDIELSFPEVNQQFINANKETVIIANDLDAMSSDGNGRGNSILNTENISTANPKLDSEKEVSKLSKFRKIKRNEAECKENQFLSPSQSLRTDSVIIKNPENTKGFEKITEKTHEINLTTNNLINDSPVCDNTNSTDIVGGIKNANEIAIDFSLSKFENTLDDKQPKFLSDINNIENLHSPLTNETIGQQLPECSNSGPNFLSNNSNDTLVKGLISDEIIETNTCLAPENITEITENEIQNIEIKERNDEFNLTLEKCSENLSNIIVDTCNKITESNNNQSTGEKMDCDTLLDEAEATCNIKKIEVMEAQNTQDTQLLTVPKNVTNQKEDYDDILPSSTMLAIKYNDITCIEDSQSTEVIKNNFNLSKQNEIEACNSEFNNTEKSIFCDQLNVDMKTESKRTSFLKKELFSSQIQNLILQQEGQSGLLKSLQSENKKSFPITETNVMVSNACSWNPLKLEETGVTFCITDSVIEKTQTSKEVRSESSNIDHSSISYPNLNATSNDFNDVENYSTNKLQTNTLSNCDIVESDILVPADANANIITNVTKIEINSEISDAIDCPISDLNVKITTIDNQKSNPELIDSKIPFKETAILENQNDDPNLTNKDHQPKCNNHEINSTDSDSTKHKNNTIKDMSTHSSAVNNLHSEHLLATTNQEHFESSMNVGDDIITKSDAYNSTADDMSILANNESQLNSPVRDLICNNVMKSKHETELSNITNEPCDGILLANVVSSNDDQSINCNINDIQRIDDESFDENLTATDSGIHDIEPETSICEEQVDESVDTLPDTSTCSDKAMILPRICTNSKESLVRRGLKRSLSDSALHLYNSDNENTENCFEDIQLNSLVAKKPRKSNDFFKFCTPQLSSTDVFNIHNNRRNSISSIYNDENMSFCIVIDNNCIITEENEEGEKICFTQIPDECLTSIHAENIHEDELESTSEIVLCPQNSTEYNEPLLLEISDEKTLEESWVDDVACVETVVSDDIELSTPPSCADIDEQENDDSDIFTSVSEYTEKVKFIYGDKMCNDDADLVETLYRTPQMDVNKTLVNRESHTTDDEDEFYQTDSITDDRTETDCQKVLDQELHMSDMFESTCGKFNETSNDDNLESVGDSKPNSELTVPTVDHNRTDKLFNASQDNSINSCESSVDGVFSYNQDENCSNYSVFSSPEVSSTTSEEKNTTLLLKITNYQGTRTAQLNDMALTKTNSCKFTENMNYTNFIGNSTKPRPLITKAAQKYIPPLKETVVDLKVKLPLPQDSLMKFKQLKISKTRIKQSVVSKKEIPKKPKPKFEDVLKSIDEMQFKKHKEKSKKPKKAVPKVLIKKNENGSHYASTPNNECYNPDLTGRKWQPWVFIEKNVFIDKMALKRKTKAIFNHRKNTYVCADKFKKYKSIPSAKFVITQPKLDNTSVGHLKYTIRLKHSY